MAIRSIDRDKCKACGKCVTVCPMDVFRQVGTFVYLAYPRDCMTCFLCELECPAGAIYVGPERGSEKTTAYY
jgi:NAD-dependent dihydropyrimidine dehydrogenase PreA subunit